MKQTLWRYHKGRWRHSGCDDCRDRVRYVHVSAPIVQIPTKPGEPVRYGVAHGTTYRRAR